MGFGGKREWRPWVGVERGVGEAEGRGEVIGRLSKNGSGFGV